MGVTWIFARHFTHKPRKEKSPVPKYGASSFVQVCWTRELAQKREGSRSCLVFALGANGVFQLVDDFFWHDLPEVAAFTVPVIEDRACKTTFGFVHMLFDQRTAMFVPMLGFNALPSQGPRGVSTVIGATRTSAVASTPTRRARSLTNARNSAGPVSWARNRVSFWLTTGWLDTRAPDMGTG